MQALQLNQKQLIQNRLMKSRNRVLNENNTIQDKESRYYNKNTLVLDMQTPISGKKFTLNQNNKNGESLLQIKPLKKDDKKAAEATHYKQYLQNEESKSKVISSSRLDQTKRVGSTLREKPDASLKQLTLASNNLLSENAENA